MARQPKLFEDEEEDRNGEFFTRETIRTWRDQVPETWRKPDVMNHMPFGVQLIWYGPGGVNGEAATELISDIEAGTIEVSEYSSIVGLFDPGTYDEDTPILKHTTQFSVKAVLKALRDAGIRPKRGTLLLWAVGLGVAQLSYWGGDDEFVEALPQ